MYSLKDKVVIVTGGANGIGAEIVKSFLNEDPMFVAILDINDSLGLSLEKELKIKHGEEKVRFFDTDVTNDIRLFEVFHKVTNEFGAIDVIVNNAGVICEHLVQKEINVNFTALVTSSLKGLELMRKDQGGKGGTIINISSIAALKLLSPSVFVYGATKSAILHFSNCIGKEEYFRHTDVRVLTVCFGLTDTDIINDLKGRDDITSECVKKIVKKITDDNTIQSATVAAQGVVHSYKAGISGSTWLVGNSKTIEISSDVKDAYEIMSKHVTI